MKNSLGHLSGCERISPATRRSGLGGLSLRNLGHTSVAPGDKGDRELV